MLFELYLALAAATLSLAATPKGFQPASEIPLMVSFGGLDATGGKIVDKSISQTAPQLSLASQLTGTSFAVVMVDLDIPTNSPPQTNTLLHWMQTGLTQSTSATRLNTTAGAANVFTFQIPGAVAAAASYIAPAPPARTPLSHRYTQILIDTSAASQESLNVLVQAAQSRMGFNAEQVLTQAGLQSKVVAGNFFNVTNPGPAQGSTTGNTGNSSTSTGTAQGTGTVNQPSQSSVFTGLSTVHQVNSVLLGAIILVAVCGAV